MSGFFSGERPISDTLSQSSVFWGSRGGSPVSGGRDSRGNVPDYCGHTWRFFFADRGTVAVSKSHCDKIAQPDGLTLLAIHSDERRKSRECAHLSNAGEFNHGCLTCQISAILYADRGDRRKSQSRHRAHLSIFADRSDRRIKSPSVSLALLH